MATLRENDFQEKSAKFLSWFGQLPGASISPNIQIADMRCRNAGRGIIALKDIEEHEELFSIPISDLLTVQNSSLPKRLPDEFEKLDPWMSLILVMIYEAGRGQESKWGPYLHMLPSEFDTLMYWSSVELAELQGSSVVDKIGKDHANRLFLDCLLPVVKDHAGIFGKFASTFSDPDADAALLEIAHRMATLIMAYAFDLEHDGGSDESFEDDSSTAPDRPKAMVPLADIFNADGDMMNAHLLQQEQSVAMVASRALTKGQEIFNDYGQRPRSDLLRRYGYVTDNAKKWDVVELDRDTVLGAAIAHHEINESEKEKRLQLINHWEVFEDGYDLRRQPPGQNFEFDADLVLVIHAYTMNQDAVKAATKAGEPADEQPFNLDVALVLKKIITQRLNQYSTSIAEDTVLLRNSALQGRQRMAIEVRLGEKEILAAALDCVGKRIEASNQAISPNRKSTKESTIFKKRRV